VFVTKEAGSISRILASEQELESLAARVAENSNRDLVIFLQGDLGAGKTTFARGFLRGCGIEGVVKSPTYTLVEPYQLADGKMAYHFDLYRLSHGEELEFTGARDYFDGQSTCLVEWPERAEGFLPAPDIDCHLEYHAQGRRASITGLSDRGRQTMLRVFAD
jgi:tRNA threonylcarbamoyladenosine biosynthesis protein TsaE